VTTPSPSTELNMTSPSTELNMTQRQSRIFRELNANMDYQTMVGVVARYLLTQPGTFLILSEFVYDDEGDLTGVKSLASANRQMTYVTNTFFLRWSQIPTRMRQSVLDDELYVLEDVAKLANETTSLEFFKLLEDVLQIAGRQRHTGLRSHPGQH